MPKRTHRNWTEAEEEKLARLYGTKSLETIARIMGRSVGAIISKRTKMKLGAFLESGDYITLNQLLKAVKGLKYGGSYAITSWVENRGLPVINKRVGKCSFRVIRLDDFWKWAEANKSFLDFSKTAPLILGKEPDWVKAKRKEDELCRLVKKTTPWTKIEDARLRSYISEGKKTGDEIAELLNRSYGAVIRRCRVLGLANPKRIGPHAHSWSSDEMIEVIESVINAIPYTLIARRMQISEKAIRGLCYRLYKTENQDKIRDIIRKEG